MLTGRTQNNLPMLQQRMRFVKTLLWAMPEHSQHIGAMIALGVDAVQWKCISDELVRGKHMIKVWLVYSCWCCRFLLC